jgi:hypothetical protein
MENRLKFYSAGRDPIKQGKARALQTVIKQAPFESIIERVVESHQVIREMI